MVERHESNIRREEKAGVKREYEPLYDNRKNWVEPTQTLVVEDTGEEDTQMDNNLIYATGTMSGPKP